MSPPTKFISSTYEDGRPDFSPDGKRITFSSNRTGQSEVWICDSDGSNAIPLTSFGAQMSRWSPDGERISFTSQMEGQPEIYVMNANGSQPKRLTTSLSQESLPSWSQDGKWIYFGSNRSGEWQVWKIPAKGGEPVQVTQKSGVEGFESSDGKFVYYAKRWGVAPSVWKVPVGGGEETQVLESVVVRAFVPVKEGFYFIPKPIPHGAYSTWYWSMAVQIQFFSYATRKTRTVITIDGPLLACLAVSPDERQILYVQVDHAGGDLMLIENFR